MKTIVMCDTHAWRPIYIYVFGRGAEILGQDSVLGMDDV